MATTDWNPILRAELDKPYWAELQQFVHRERSTHQVFPPHDEVFAALHLTPYADVKVLILGQDPYHGPGQAHGLCFSVRPGVAVPPSLVNIYAELESDLGIPPADHGHLTGWARQGVLLLNTTLTVRARQAASHQKRGWETFTDEVIKAVSAKEDPVVFVLWGAAAGKKKALIDTSRHHIVQSAHPSPLSAHRGFLGSKPFSRINDILQSSGRGPIDWRLPAIGSQEDEANEGVTTGEPETPTTAEPAEDPARSGPPPVDDYVGLDLESAKTKAEAEGRPMRVGRLDEELFPMTRDYRPDRITVEVDNNVVTAAIPG